jgi:hypothetical protein
VAEYALHMLDPQARVEQFGGSRMPELVQGVTALALLVNQSYLL